MVIMRSIMINFTLPDSTQLLKEQKVVSFQQCLELSSQMTSQLKACLAASIVIILVFLAIILFLTFRRHKTT